MPREKLPRDGDVRFRHAVCMALVGLLGHAIPGAAAEELTFTTWGGTYAQAQSKMIAAPFSAVAGVKVNIAEYQGGIEQLRRQQAAGRIEWDVVDITMGDALAACKEGLLEKIDPAQLEAGLRGEPAREDYLPGALTECFAGTTVWSTVLVFNRKKFPEPPRSVKDLFDVAQFPGKRALQKAPEGNLEWALMADGVPVESVYAVLSTPEGIARAFRKLDAIRPHVVWWESGAQPQQLMSSGQVSMASAYNNRVYAEMVRSETPMRYLWDGQLLNIEGLVVVKGTRNLASARAFVRYATRPSVIASMAPLLAHGPTRISASELIDPVMHHMLPTAAWYRKRSLFVDAQWWARNGDAARRQFSEWLARCTSGTSC